MDRLWAPWRIQYLTGEAHAEGCVFCAMLAARQDRKNFIFARSAHCFAGLNLYPYNNGHSLILPYRHVDDLSCLSPEEGLDLLDLLNQTKARLAGVLKPDGFNLGLNLGRAAGAGSPGHVHMHIVPRWQGDVNFMPIVNGTRVISQSLRALYALLTAPPAKARRPKLERLVAEVLGPAARVLTTGESGAVSVWIGGDGTWHVTTGAAP